MLAVDKKNRANSRFFCLYPASLKLGGYFKFNTCKMNANLMCLLYFNLCSWSPWCSIIYHIYFGTPKELYL